MALVPQVASLYFAFQSMTYVYYIPRQFLQISLAHALFHSVKLNLIYVEIQTHLGPS